MGEVKCVNEKVDKGLTNGGHMKGKSSVLGKHQGMLICPNGQLWRPSIPFNHVFIKGYLRKRFSNAKKPKLSSKSSGLLILNYPIPVGFALKFPALLNFLYVVKYIHPRATKW